MFSKSLKLEILIRTSNIPKKYKKELLKKLVKKDTLPLCFNDMRVKTFFYSGMSYRAYDLFTTSIYALIDGNADSLNTLLRAQLENIFVINYFLKNSTEIKNALTPEFYDTKNPGYFRKSMDNTEYWNSLYRFLSNKAHPFADGLKSYFGNYYVLTDKNGKPEWEPTLSVKSYHSAIDPEELEDALKSIIDLFDIVSSKVKDILTVCPDDKIESYKTTHKRLWKDYFKGEFPKSF